MKYVVNMSATPIIFPELTRFIMEQGTDLKIVGKREADTRLAAVLFDYALSSDQTKLPDCMFYNTELKKWTAIELKADDVLTLTNKGSEVLTIKKQSLVSSKPNFLTVVKNFVTQFSSASILV